MTSYVLVDSEDLLPAALVLYQYISNCIIQLVVGVAYISFHYERKHLALAILWQVWFIICIDSGSTTIFYEWQEHYT